MNQLFTRFFVASVITGLVLFMLWLVFLAVTGTTYPSEIAKIAGFSAFVTSFLAVKTNV